MSRWYRAYEGTVTDAKFGEVALVASCSRSVAIAAWHSILESCASTNEGGRFDTTPRRIAVILSEPVTTIELIFKEFSNLEMISENMVCAWSKRQFQRDNSTERVNRYRDKHRSVVAPMPVTVAETPVTVAETPPYTETETETEKKEKDATASSSTNGLNGHSLDPPKPIEGLSVEKTSKRQRKAESDQAILDRITDVWNDWARRHSSPGVAFLTGLRAQHCRLRLADLDPDHSCAPEDTFRKLLSKCETSFFVRGSPRSPLKFDQLLRESFMVQMMEGAFEYRPANGGSQWQNRNR